MRQKTYNKHLIRLLLVLLLCATFYDCHNNPKLPPPSNLCGCEECVDDSCNKDSCICTKSEPIILSSTVIFIDGSASMQCYITPTISSNFSAVVNAIEGLVPDSCTEYIFKKTKELISGDNLSKSISEKKLKLDGQESDLGAMLFDMISGANLNSCAYFLITDGILSTSNENIHRNREWNKVHRDLLQSEIETILRKGKNKIASIVLQYKAPYNGVYTAYDNQTKKPLTNEIRPYYIIALGNPAVIQQVFKEINTGRRSGFEGFTNMALYGYDYGLDSPIIDETEGVLVVEDGYKVLSTVGKISLTYDVSKLPKYILEEKDSLKSHVCVKSTNINGDINDLKNGEQFNVELDDNKLKIRIKDKYDLCIPGDLEVRIAWWQPNWIDASTSDDDKEPDSTKTFNLKYLLYPFSQLNGGDESGYIDEKHIIKLIK